MDDTDSTLHMDVDANESNETPESPSSPSSPSSPTRHYLHIDHADAPPDQPPAMTRKPINELPQGKLIGASLLCYCVDPTWSRLYFLLGKERKNLRWRAGSEKWSGFGGRTSSKVLSAEETAAKEFVEETLAMVKYFERDTLPRTSFQDIADSLRRHDYTFQLVFSFGEGEGARNYVTFVRQIPWDPQAINRFSECREMLLNPGMHYGSMQWNRLVEPNPGIRLTCASEQEVNIQINKDYLEKKMLGLWSIPQLQHAVESNGIMSRREGRVERCRTGFTCTAELVLSELAFYQPEAMQESTYRGGGSSGGSC